LVLHHRYCESHEGWHAPTHEITFLANQSAFSCSRHAPGCLLVLGSTIQRSPRCERNMRAYCHGSNDNIMITEKMDATSAWKARRRVAVGIGCAFALGATRRSCRAYALGEADVNDASPDDSAGCGAMPTSGGRMLPVYDFPHNGFMHISQFLRKNADLSFRHMLRTPFSSRTGTSWRHDPLRY